MIKDDRIHHQSQALYKTKAPVNKQRLSKGSPVVGVTRLELVTSAL